MSNENSQVQDTDKKDAPRKEAAYQEYAVLLQKGTHVSDNEIVQLKNIRENAKSAKQRDRANAILKAIGNIEPVDDEKLKKDEKNKTDKNSVEEHQLFLENFNKKYVSAVISVKKGQLKNFEKTKENGMSLNNFTKFIKDDKVKVTDSKGNLADKNLIKEVYLNYNIQRIKRIKALNKLKNQDYKKSKPLKLNNQIRQPLQTQNFIGG